MQEHQLELNAHVADTARLQVCSKQQPLAQPQATQAPAQAQELQQLVLLHVQSHQLLKQLCL